MIHYSHYTTFPLCPLYTVALDRERNEIKMIPLFFSQQLDESSGINALFPADRDTSSSSDLRESSSRETMLSYLCLRRSTRIPTLLVIIHTRLSLYRFLTRSYILIYIQLSRRFMNSFLFSLKTSIFTFCTRVCRIIRYVFFHEIE